LILINIIISTGPLQLSFFST